VPGAARQLNGDSISSRNQRRKSLLALEIIAMKMLPAAGVAWLVVCVSVATAQQPTPSPTANSFTPPSLSAPPVTPELWVYSQEQRRHDDPALAVRRKAEIQADQRLARLAAMKWHGFSNSRPVASPMPFTGQYSPAWVGNGWERYDWVGGSTAPSTLYVEGYTIAR
jgi:hypothetical protein